MTLTVRLDSAVESALDRYCAERGVTKSLVVQESLAEYLLADKARRAGDPTQGGARKEPVSENYRAFAEAGLIGGGDLGGVSATNAVVRERAMQRTRRKTE
jgi:hypothetical protein